jgi:hypothetical protein
MKLSGTVKWIGLALVGLAIAGGVAIAASRLVSEQIGIASESVSAGEDLAPAVGSAARTRASDERDGGGASTEPETDGPAQGTEPEATQPVETTAPETTPPPDSTEASEEDDDSGKGRGRGRGRGGDDSGGDDSSGHGSGSDD